MLAGLVVRVANGMSTYSHGSCHCLLRIRYGGMYSAELQRTDAVQIGLVKRQDTAEYII